MYVFPRLKLCALILIKKSWATFLSKTHLVTLDMRYALRVGIAGIDIESARSELEFSRTGNFMGRYVYSSAKIIK
jgi:hypothetical protein